MYFLKYSVSWVVAVPGVQTEAVLCKQRAKTTAVWLVQNVKVSLPSVYTGPKLKILIPVTDCLDIL